MISTVYVEMAVAPGISRVIAPFDLLTVRSVLPGGAAALEDGNFIFLDPADAGWIGQAADYLRRRANR
jgi:hypothetical protein